MANIYANADNPNEIMGNHDDLKNFAEAAVQAGASQVIVQGEEAIIMSDNNETAPEMPACILPCECETKTKPAHNLKHEITNAMPACFGPELVNNDLDDNSAPVMPPCINAVSNEDSSDAINRVGRSGGGFIKMGDELDIDKFGKRAEESETISQPPSVIG